MKAVLNFFLLAAVVHGVVVSTRADPTDDACKLLSDEKGCDANTDCTWCISHAVKSACFNKTMADFLPPSIFACDSLLLGDSDDPCKAVKDETTCDKTSNCTWCKSAAVASECVNEAMAKKLPPAVFKCDVGPKLFEPESFHASCKMTFKFASTSCNDVINALSVAAKSMSGLSGCGKRFPPVDSFCGYSETGRTASSWSGKHVTANGKYTDDLTFTMTAAGSGCSAAAYSTSETWYAVLDNGVNYCNLHNLVAETKIANTEADVSDSTCTQYSKRNCNRY